MTYRPVDNPGPRGRPPLPIDPRLVAQLAETLASGRPYRAGVTGRDPDQVEAFVREIRRAGYRHYGGFSLHVRRDATHVRYWLTVKRKAAS